MMNDTPSLNEDRRQAWRMVGAIAVLISIGMFGLLAGSRFSDHTNDQQDRSLHRKLDRQAGEILVNRARINQLEEDYANRGIPVPAPTTTTTVPHRSTSTTRPTTRSTTTTSSPRPTTSTTAPPPRGACIAGVCIPRPQEKP